MGQAKLLLVSVLFLMRVETIRPMRDYLRGELTISYAWSAGGGRGLGGLSMDFTVYSKYS